MSRHLTIIVIIAIWFSLARPAGAACNFHNINGWVWSSNAGWISLNCSNTGAAVDYGLDIAFGGASAPVTGYAWSANAGWIDFQPAGPYPAAPNNAALYKRTGGGGSSAGALTGWAKVVALGDDGWMKLGPIKFGSTDYGVTIDNSKVFSGWSFNGGDDLGFGNPDPEQGWGWVSWRGDGYYGSASGQWFETLYGDIVGGGNLGQAFAPPGGRYSATYLIQANGAIDPVTITSAGGAAVPYRQENFPKLNLPQQSNNYRGSLGWLDRAGMVNGYYGEVVKYTGNQLSSDIFGNSIMLDNKVYYITGDLTVDRALTFSKGNGNEKARGAVVVDGALIINENIDYQGGPVASRIDNLPSAGWIVKGDIIINPSVTSVVGVLYSEGAAGISTGTTGASATDKQLIISGLVAAKKINLQRLWVRASNEPAEQFIFDGRAIANPPPGLVDMAKGLPTLRQVTPPVAP